MRFLTPIIVLIFMISCKKGNLKHERYVYNNTSADTVIVINPDFDDAIDTIPPGEIAFIYSFEVLDTQQESEPCKWIGDTLLIYNQDEVHLNRSVKTESFWTFTIQGDSERKQECTFTIIDGDF